MVSRTRSPRDAILLAASALIPQATLEHSTARNTPSLALAGLARVTSTRHDAATGLAARVWDEDVRCGRALWLWREPMTRYHRALGR